MPLLTPDGRYIVVIGKAGPRLWRAANPHLSSEVRENMVAQLMKARRAIGNSKKADEISAARREVDAAKLGLGERGPVWWDDGSPDLNRRLVKNSPYADWYLTRGFE